MQCSCILENRSSWRAGEASGLVAQPGLWVCVCFLTDVAFARNACWLLRGVICKMFLLISLSSCTEDSLRCEHSRSGQRPSNPPCACSIVVVAAFARSWPELGWSEWSRVEGNDNKFACSYRNEWECKFAVCLLLHGTCQHVLCYYRAKSMWLTPLMEKWYPLPCLLWVLSIKCT